MKNNGYQIKVDSADSASVYVGRAGEGITTEAGWQIKRIKSDGTGQTIQFKQGSRDFAFTWASRTDDDYR